MPCTDEATSHVMLDRFVELGGNFIDTANANTTSENVIGNWLSKNITTTIFTFMSKC